MRCRVILYLCICHFVEKCSYLIRVHKLENESKRNRSAVFCSSDEQIKKRINIKPKLLNKRQCHMEANIRFCKICILCMVSVCSESAIEIKFIILIRTNNALSCKMDNLLLLPLSLRSNGLHILVRRSTQIHTHTHSSTSSVLFLPFLRVHTHSHFMPDFPKSKGQPTYVHTHTTANSHVHICDNSVGLNYLTFSQ